MEERQPSADKPMLLAHLLLHTRAAVLCANEPRCAVLCAIDQVLIRTLTDPHEPPTRHAELDDAHTYTHTHLPLPA